MQNKRGLFVWTGLVTLAGAIAVAQQKQSAPLQFEVASIKLVSPPMGPHGVGLLNSRGTIRLEGATLRQIIVQAYSIPRTRVLVGQGWYDSDQFDIVAKAEDENATPEQIREMLRTLLADRFRLAVHLEKRILTAYSLAVGNRGSKITEANDAQSGMQLAGNKLIVRKMPISAFTNMLANMVNEPVEDRTGLSGSYSFELAWDVPDHPSDLGSPGDGRAGLPSPEYLLSALPDALASLGLEWRAQKGSVEILSLDHAERPSEN